MTRLLMLAAVSVLAAVPAAAQYKIVGPDGSVTYTDRPPPTTAAKVTAIGRRGGAPVSTDADLPFELRQIVARFPVTLYSAADCAPCDSGRQLLQQRGIPYTERRIVTEDDAAALERAVGGRTVPALTIGAQALRGLSQGDWSSYLDAAGYPRESKLPRGYQAPAATPLTERATPVARAASAAAPPPVDTETPPPAATGIRF